MSYRIAAACLLLVAATAAAEPPGVPIRFGTEELRAPNSAIALSADGKTIVAVSRTLVVREFDAADGRLKSARRLGDPQIRNGILSLDGKWFVSQDMTPKGNSLEVWDLATRQRAYSGIVDIVRAAAFVPNGAEVYVLFHVGDSYSVRRLDFASQKWQEVFAPPKHDLYDTNQMEVSPDGRRILTGGAHADLICWDVATGKEVWRSRDFVGPFVFSPDSRRIVCGRTSQRGLAFRDAAKGDPIDTVPAIEPYVYQADYDFFPCFGLRFTPDGKGLVFSDHDRGVVVWDIAAGKERYRLPIGFSSNRHLVFTADGKSLITLQPILQRWDLATGKPQYRDNEAAGHSAPVRTLAFSPHGRRLLTGSDDRTARVWTVATATPTRIFRGHGQSQVNHGAFLPASRLVITAGTGSLRLWDADSGQEVRAVPVKHAGEDFVVPAVEFLCVSPDGKSGTVMSRGANTYQLLRCDLTNGKTDVKAFERGIALAPDGRTGISYSDEHQEELRLIDIESRVAGAKLVLPPREGPLNHFTFVEDTRFSRDGRLVAAAGQRWRRDHTADYSVYVWASSGGPPLRVIPIREERHVPLAFSRDGRLLAFADPEALHVWDLAVGRELWHKADSIRAVTALAFTPDRSALAAGYDDGMILLWPLPPLAKGKPIAAAERNAVWEALGSSDPTTAFAALWRLVDDPVAAVALLRPRLVIVPASPETVQGLVADLGNNEFKKRDAAERRLRELGRAAEAELRQAMKSESRPEAVKRLKELLKAIDAMPVAEARAIGALEHISTQEARKLLEDIGNAGDTRFAAEAREALRRSANR